MNYRRFNSDRINPRNVPASRHTIFIRGLPGTTNVDEIKDHFLKETNSRCSIEFFSVSEDRIRLSVAIRFKTHDVARAMLVKYNGKSLIGHNVEVSWFKDLKKAKARFFDDNRNGRFQNGRNGFRGRGLTSNRNRQFSPPYHKNQENRRVRDRSLTPNTSRSNRDNNRRLHSRAQSGSSRSSSSKSRSRSCKRRRNVDAISNSSLDKKNNINKLELSRTSNRSPSRSSSNSSSRSSSANSAKPLHNTHTDLNSSPIVNDNKQYNERICVSPQNNEFLNAKDNSDTKYESNLISGNLFSDPNPPSLDASEGSALLTGLIQLKPHRTLYPQLSDSHKFNQDNPTAHSLISSHQQRSRSESDSEASSRSASFTNERTDKLKALSNRLSSSSSIADRNGEEGKTDTKTRNLNSQSFVSPSNKSYDLIISPSNFNSSIFSSRNEKMNTDAFSKRSRQPSDGERWRPVGYSDAMHKPRKRSNATSASLTPINADNKFSDDASKQLETESHRIARSSIPVGDKLYKNDADKTNRLANDSPVEALKNIKDKQTFIQERKKTIEEEYKRDCETFATVVRTLISKDNDLESKLLLLLKEILHERGQRCIDELRASITDEQPLIGTKYC